MSLQVYKNMDEFVEKIISEDPMKEFRTNIKKINWEKRTRECRECGKEFVALHPAKVFCDSCSEKTDKKNKNEPVIQRLKRKVVTKECESCGNEFVLTAPAMRKCENCSPTGGKIVYRS